jgi:hypothetical protein
MHILHLLACPAFRKRLPLLLLVQDYFLVEKQRQLKMKSHFTMLYGARLTHLESKQL